MQGRQEESALWLCGLVAALLEDGLDRSLPEESFPSHSSKNPPRTSLIIITKPERLWLRLVRHTTQLIPGMPLQRRPDTTVFLSFKDEE